MEFARVMPSSVFLELVASVVVVLYKLCVCVCACVCALIIVVLSTSDLTVWCCNCLVSKLCVFVCFCQHSTGLSLVQVFCVYVLRSCFVALRVVTLACVVSGVD